MKNLTSLSMATALVASLGAFASTPSTAAETATGAVQVSGEKRDSGLGALPHYGKWADPTGKNPLRLASDASGTKVQVAGEKNDSGLGDLPHYSQWADPTGKNPAGRRAVQASQAN